MLTNTPASLRSLCSVIALRAQRVLGRRGILATDSAGRFHASPGGCFADPKMQNPGRMPLKALAAPGN